MARRGWEMAGMRTKGNKAPPSMVGTTLSSIEAVLSFFCSNSYRFRVEMWLLIPRFNRLRSRRSVILLENAMELR